MPKLTATGKPFGNATVTLPEGAFDRVWKMIKKDLSEKGKEPMRKIISVASVLNVTDKELKAILIKYCNYRENFPDELSEEDFDRYMDELIEMFHESMKDS